MTPKSPLVISALRSGCTLDDLAVRYKIKSRRAVDNPHLVSLKYNRIDSPFGEQLVRECRGLTLDDRNWSVVSWPFDKFFNEGEMYAAPIDWTTARIMEKVDGTLIHFTEYMGKWIIGTTGTPDAAGQVPFKFGETWSAREDVEFNHPSSFREYFLQAASLYTSAFTRPPHDIGGFTFMVELMGPLNRVVVEHKTARIALLGARNNCSGQEMSAEAAAQLLWDMTGIQFPVVRSYDMSDLQSLIQTFDTMDPFQQEGYVVCDSNFNRVKVKNPKYVAIHHTLDGLSDRSMADVVRMGEAEEFCASFGYSATFAGNAVRRVQEIQTAYDKHIQMVEAEYDRIKNASTQKEFALEAVKSGFSAPLFQLRAGKVTSIRQFYEQCQIELLLIHLNMQS